MISDKFSPQVLLIATIGGKPEPVVTSILEWKPARVLFVPSVETVARVNSILDLLQKNGCPLGEGEIERVKVSNSQNFSLCVREMRDGLEPHVVSWRTRGESFRCVADFTGGTKCMSAALALVARPWPATQFSYVGGTQREMKGVGVVVSGNEQVVYSYNPWDTLGYQVVEDAVAAFDRGSYAWGANRLMQAVKHLEQQGFSKSELSILAALMEGYDRWDRFEYGLALQKFDQCDRGLNNLYAILRHIRRDKLRLHIKEAREKLKLLNSGSSRLSRPQILDLFANAARRRKEGRHVDAVARLYRAIEAVAQLRLREKYNIETASVPIEKVPQEMLARLKPQPAGGNMKFALQDAYDLLLHKEDCLGKLFSSWNDCKSPLPARNYSIAGHGFKPVSSKVSDKMWEGALLLAECEEEDIYAFPSLGAR